MKNKEKIRIKKLIINSAIAGGLVFLGSFSSGIITTQGIIVSISASLIVFLTKFKDGFNKKGMKGGLFEFI